MGRQKTRMLEYCVVSGELFTDYSDHPRKLAAKPKNSNQQAPDATSFFLLKMFTVSSLPERLLSSVARCGIAADCRAWRFTHD